MKNIVVSIGPLLAGLLLVVSGVLLGDGGYSFLAALDILLGLILLWQSIDRFDPPADDPAVYYKA